jgi:hypothetical protein
LIHQSHLSSRGNGGIFCDEGGAFIGAVPMLARTHRNGKDEWRPRDCDHLSEELSAQYGLPVDMSSKGGGLAAIAKALNEGDVVRAQSPPCCLASLITTQITPTMMKCSGV